MTKANIVRLVAAVLVLAITVFVDLNIEHPAWAKDLAFWQPEGQRDIALRYGVDLGGGLSVQLVADTSMGQTIDPASMEATRAIVRSRAQDLAISDPAMQIVDARQIPVTMSTVQDAGVVSRILSAEGLVEIVDVGTEDPTVLLGTTVETAPAGSLPAESPISTPAPPLTATVVATPTAPTATNTPTATTTAPTVTMTPTAAVTATPTTTATQTVTPTTPLTPTIPSTPTEEMEPVPPTTPIYETVLTNDELERVELKQAYSSAQDSTITYAEFKPTPQGATILDLYAMARTGHYLCITLDKQVVGCAGLQGSTLVQRDAKGNPLPLSFYAGVGEAEIAPFNSILRSGRLPVPLKVETAGAAEPTLGQATVRRVGIATIIGLAAALVLLPAHYRFPGLLADLALVFFGFIGLALCKVIPVPITLPSITGFAVAALLALQAHCTIFERLREGIRAHRSLPKAVKNSFSDAWRSVRDTHLGLLLFSVVVWAAGAATAAMSIRWLGVALTAGTLVSALVTLVFTRLLMSLASNVSQEWLHEREWLLGI
jgi:protein-export membrane protein SecD